MAKNIPAFPVVVTNITDHYAEGMQLRDYFAIHLLSAWLSNSNVNNQTYEAVCNQAYQIADLMMTVREKNNE